MDLLKYAQQELAEKSTVPEFKAGDTVTVHYKIKEGDKERIQQYQGVVLQRRGENSVESFTVRKISNGVGVERIFPVLSPFIDKIEVNKRGVVRRARIFYIRELTGKKARIKEKKAPASAASEKAEKKAAAKVEREKAEKAPKAPKAEKAPKKAKAPKAAKKASAKA